MFQAGGWVMYPLLALSLLSVALCCERAIFWMLVHSGGRRRRLRRLSSKARKGDRAGALALAEADGTFYGRVAAAVLRSGNGAEATALAQEQMEAARPAIERFSVTLSTIITAAPMLGILGTVTGIIRSFQLLGGAGAVTDPGLVAAGIAEALYTTAFGLIVALVTLFPYVLFRAQADRAYGRLEALATVLSAGQAGEQRQGDKGVGQIGQV